MLHAAKDAFGGKPTFSWANDMASPLFYRRYQIADQNKDLSTTH